MRHSVNSEQSNWRPRSVVFFSGVPYRDIHPKMNVYATVSASMPHTKGYASAQRENRSIHVKQYRNPFDGGSGSIKSIFTCANRHDGNRYDEIGE